MDRLILAAAQQEERVVCTFDRSLARPPGARLLG